MEGYALGLGYAIRLNMYANKATHTTYSAFFRKIKQFEKKNRLPFFNLMNLDIYTQIPVSSTIRKILS